MNDIQKRAAEALRVIAAAEHKILYYAGKQDGYMLSVLDTSEATDKVYDAWFSFSFQGKQVAFTFSLGFDPDTSRYWPMVEVNAGDDADPIEFDTRVVAGKPVPQHELLEAVDLLGREASEARVKLFQWFEGLAISASKSQDIADNT